MFFDHYPYTNFHNVNLDWVLQAVKAWGQTVEANDRAFQDLKEANEDFKSYVTNYLQDLDLSDEINTKLDQMLASGVLTPYFAPYVQGYVNSWLNSHVTPTSPALDNTLTLSGAAARADAAGKRLKDLAYIDSLSTPEVIAALNRSQVLPGYRVQGITYDYNGHYYVCGGSVDEDGTGVIVKMTKPDFTGAEITVIPQLGHANDITYYNGYLYVCTVGGGNAPQWGIYKINANDFSDKTLISNAPENTIGISYRQGDFWILAPYRIYRTTDFTTYEVVVANTNDLLTAYGIPTSDRISQTIFRTAGYLIGWVCSFVFEDRHYGALTFFNSAGEAVAFKMFPAYQSEIQGAVYADMSIYLMADGGLVNVFRMDPRHLSYVQLKAGDDLNSFTGRGTLYSTGSNVSAELLNSPSAGEGFTVQVERLGVYNTIQTARTNSGRELYRVKSFSAGTWGEWIEPAAEVAEIKEDLSFFNPIPVNNIDVSMLEKGNWNGAKKDTYKQAYRARSASFLYALDNIDVCIKERSSEARFVIIVYNAVKVVLNNTGWKTYYRIPKGCVFTVTLTNSNASTATEKTVDEIYDMFAFVADTKNVIDSTDGDITACVGTPENPSNIFQAYYTTRLTMLDYIKCDKRLLKAQSTNGYKYALIGYDEKFEMKKFNIYGGGFKTGLNYIDVSDYSYVRVILANSTDTAMSVSDIENISIEKSVPLFLSGGDKTIKSYSKDGINQERKAYAPLYPQSSIVSFQKAFDQGFRSLIMHLQFTVDNKMVVLHDVIIDNSAVNSDGTPISGEIRVDSLTLEQLDQYDFGLKFGEKYRGTKITRFADALMFAKKHNLNIQIEQMASNVTNAQLDLMCNELKTFGYIGSNACYWSTKYVNVNYVHGVLPDIDLSMTLGSTEAITAWAERFANLKGRSNNVIFYEYLSTLTSDVIATMAQYGIEAMAQDFEGDEPDNIVGIIDTHSYVSRVVSQIVPAKYALLT